MSIILKQSTNMLRKIKILTISQIFQYVQQEQTSMSKLRKEMSWFITTWAKVSSVTHRSKYSTFWQRAAEAGHLIAFSATWARVWLVVEQIHWKSRQWVEITLPQFQKVLWRWILNLWDVFLLVSVLIFIEEFLNIHKIERIS